MRIHRRLYPPAVPVPVGVDRPHVPPLDMRSRALVLPANDVEPDDGRDLWTAWVDLGGEG